MQKQSDRQESGLVKIDYDQALALLDHPLSEKILEAGVAMSVLEQDLAQDQVFYIHQLLQEYFAAQHFAEAPEPELAQQAWQADVVSPGLAGNAQHTAGFRPAAAAARHRMGGNTGSCQCDAGECR